MPHNTAAIAGGMMHIIAIAKDRQQIDPDATDAKRVDAIYKFHPESNVPDRRPRTRMTTAIENIRAENHEQRRIEQRGGASLPHCARC